MTEAWYGATELAGLPGIPGTDRGIRKLADRLSWPSRKRAKGKGLEYAFAALPAEAKTALLLRDAPKAEKARAKPGTLTQPEIAAAWDRFECGTQKARDEAYAAAAALDAVRALIAGGMGKTAARETVAAQQDCSAISLWRWEGRVRGVLRTDWPALLLAGYVGNSKEAALDEAAWDFYRGMYLDRSAPSHADCYSRLQETAAKHGWQIPCAKTMARRIERLDREVIIAAREGIQAAMRKLPGIIRDELVFQAGQAVNGDGLKFDKIWVRFEDGEVINTATGWFFQDIRCRKILAYRLGKTEHTDLFRLATYDLTGVCAPELMVIDNTRVAANLLMTGGYENRNRNTHSETHGMGLLAMIGTRAQFTNPDGETNNPGAKPIERQFGIGGIHSKVASNPEIRTYGGYSQATAVPFEVFKRVVATEVARHNAQVGRRTKAGGGKLSFDEAWDQSEKFPRVLSDSQRRLLLMCRELVTVRRGVNQVSIAAGKNAHGRNTYRADGLSRFEGKKCYVHYDPEALHSGAFLYDLAGRYLLRLEHVGTYAFDSKTAGDEVAKFRKRHRKALKKAVAEQQRMDAKERAQLYADVLPPVAAEAASKAPETVVQGHFQRVPDPARDSAAMAGDGQVITGAFEPAHKVADDGTVFDTRTGEVVRLPSQRPADGSLSEEEKAQHEWLRRAAEAQRRNQW